MGAAAAVAAAAAAAAAGHVRWLYSEARQTYEAAAIEALAALLQMPVRRVVVQTSQVDSDSRRLTLHAWLIDTLGDPSSDERPAALVAQWMG